MTNTTNKQAVPLYEITALRQDNCRVYQMSDGSQRAEYTPASATAEAQVATYAVAAASEVQADCTLVTYSWNEENNAYETGVSHTVTDEIPLYIQLTLPTLPRSPRIKRAELVIKQSEYYTVAGKQPKLALYELEGAIGTAAVRMLDYAPLRTEPEEGETYVRYCFDVTALLDKAAAGETTAANLAVKLLDSEGAWVAALYGSEAVADPPALHITYASSYGIHTGYRTHTHDLGRLGQGSVDLQCRNLMLDMEDFAWGGSRMPVTIRHQYNSAYGDVMYTRNDAIQLHTADFSAMKLGYGWKLNVMQSILAATFVHNEAACDGYVYNDENGADVYFKQSEKTATAADGTVYHLYEDVDGGDMMYDPTARTLTMGSDVYTFDEAGRLTAIADEYGNTMTITYTDGRLTAITDGAGRVFTFAYDESGFLTTITAPDETAIEYTYVYGLLNVIRYPDDSAGKIYYSNRKPSGIFLYNAQNVSSVCNVYAFDGDRMTSVTEKGGWKSGGYSTAEGAYPVTTFAYSAAANRATVTSTLPADTAEGETEPTTTTTIYTFDDEGNVVGEYMDVDGVNVGLTGETGTEKGIGTRRYSDNWLDNHDFTTDTGWTTFANNGSLTATFRSGLMYDCNHCVLLTSTAEDTVGGLRQTTAALPAGEYTFSARMRVHEAKVGTGLSGTDAGMFLKVTSADGSTVLAQSSRVNDNDRTFQLLTAPFTLTETTAVCVEITVAGAGTVVVDSAQLESNPCAGPHNRLTNGNFEKGTAGWQSSDSLLTSTESPFGGSQCLCISGDLDSCRNVWQAVDCLTPAAVRETFTLSGWAKAEALPVSAEDDKPTPTFRLRAEIKLRNVDEPEVYTADFSPCTEGWQYASVQFSKAQRAVVEYIRVYCDYDYNTGSAYFDNIQLTLDSLETGLTAEDFPGLDTEETATDTDTTSTDYEDTAADSLVPEFEEKTDEFGNPIIETTFTEGEFGTIYRSFGYDEDGNNLTVETDARGNKTTYTVDPATSRTTAVTDRCGNVTAYEYDTIGRTTKVTSKAADDTELANVAYGYNAMSNLTAITRGDGTQYALAYTPFHDLTSIGITGKSEKLVTYGYKEGKGRLKSVTYANGDVMKATYNGLGELVAEKWYDGSNELIAHYKYVYDGDGNLVRSIDIVALKEYTYTYEGGRLKAAEEFDITIGEYENVTSRTLVTYLRYAYDKDGNLAARYAPLIQNAEYYQNPEEGEPILTFYSGIQRVTSCSKTDSFGRKVFDELQLGTGFVSRRFDYVVGEVTDEHVDNKKLKSSPTTNLVSRITFADGRTIEYEYDAEERITKVIDSVDGETAYTYDALGQLLTETVNGVVVNTMTYDNYGNILTKNGVVYGYDSVWKDQLTSYNGTPITYDAQGNPLSYRGNLMEWEKGRQLKKLTKPDGTVITYTYNANGIRTSKTVGTTKHTYVLDGTKILSESIGTLPMYAHYDNEGSICGITYNNTPYYFLKDLQGDVIAITDDDGQVIARYTYDAWGKCTVVEDNSGCNIANANPFRYRSYYYDTETGLYYLQSRYYDPETGRFVNADEAVFVARLTDRTGEINLFSYCKNAPTINEDPYGYDAILLQATESVFGLGHTGLLFHSGNGWYYWYWGMKDSSALSRYAYAYVYGTITNPTLRIFTTLGKTVPAIATLKFVGFGKLFDETTNLTKIKAKTGYNSFNDKIYIKGDFSKAFSVLMERAKKKNYNLLSMNCMQTCVDGLLAGKFSTKNTVKRLCLRSARNMVIPNAAFKHLKNIL